MHPLVLARTRGVCRASLGWLALTALGCGGPPLGPPTWAAIYADYFGPGSHGSCGAVTGCHTSLADTGGVASNFVCVDRDGCYASLTGLAGLVRPSDATNPAQAALFRSLRQATGRGRMPLGSAFVFDAADIARLQTWIAHGANND